VRQLDLPGSYEHMLVGRTNVNVGRQKGFAMLRLFDVLPGLALQQLC
jgi:hypothetical protein